MMLVYDTSVVINPASEFNIENCSLGSYIKNFSFRLAAAGRGPRITKFDQKLPGELFNLHKCIETELNILGMRGFVEVWIYDLRENVKRSDVHATRRMVVGLIEVVSHCSCMLLAVVNF